MREDENCTFKPKLNKKKGHSKYLNNPDETTLSNNFSIGKKSPKKQPVIAKFSDE